MKEFPPPANTEAEAAVIGSMLIDPTVMAQLPWLLGTMFTHPGYRLAWDAAQSLTRDGAAVGWITLIDRMQRLDDGAGEYLTLVEQAADDTITSSHAGYYGRIVLKKYQQRQFLSIAQRLVQRAYDDSEPEAMGHLSMQAISQIMALSPDHTTGRKTYGEVLDLLQEDVLARMDTPAMLLRTGFPRIDAWMGGLEPGMLIYLAGRPGSGKSALGLSLARRIAAHFHHMGAGAVDVVTMEMSMLSQARRLVASRAVPALDTRRMRQGFREDDEADVAAYAQFTQYLEEDRAAIGDALAFHEGIISIDQLGVLAAESQATHGMRVLVIDQLDLFADTSRNGEYERITTISRRLKQLAMRLGIVIICLVQLNRETEKRSGAEKRPQLSDLRQSGQLEQDADAVLALYRPAYYFPPRDDWPEGTNEAYAQWAELLTLKFRDGPADLMTPMCFIGTAASYTDWDSERYPVKYLMDLVAEMEKGK